MKPSQDKKFTPEEAKLKAALFCAYQERTQQEVRDKLYSYGLRRDEVEALLADLITENFINEVRFAKAYAGGKFRIKKWGRLKIKQGLEQRNLSSSCINKAMKEIEEQDYLETLQTLLHRKWLARKESDLFLKRHKVAQYLIGRGFEPDLVWERVKEIEAQ